MAMAHLLERFMQQMSASVMLGVLQFAAFWFCHPGRARPGGAYAVGQKFAYCEALSDLARHALEFAPRHWQKLGTG